MEQIKNMSALTKDLSQVYDQLRNKELDVLEVKEIANLAGKIIKAASSQLNYNQFIKNGEHTEFFEHSHKQP